MGQSSDLGKAGQRFQETREEARVKTAEAPRPRRTSQRKSAEHGPVGLSAVKSTLSRPLCRAGEDGFLSGLPNVSRATGCFFSTHATLADEVSVPILYSLACLRGRATGLQRRRHAVASVAFVGERIGSVVREEP